MDVAIGSDNEADAHAQIVIFRPEQGVWREQGFGRTDTSAFRQSERFGNRRELGNVRGNTAKISFYLG